MKNKFFLSHFIVYFLFLMAVEKGTAENDYIYFNANYKGKQIKWSIPASNSIEEKFKSKFGFDYSNPEYVYVGTNFLIESNIKKGSRIEFLVLSLPRYKNNLAGLYYFKSNESFYTYIGRTVKGPDFEKKTYVVNFDDDDIPEIVSFWFFDADFEYNIHIDKICNADETNPFVSNIYAKDSIYTDELIALDVNVSNNAVYYSYFNSNLGYIRARLCYSPLKKIIVEEIVRKY